METKQHLNASHVGGFQNHHMLVSATSPLLAQGSLLGAMQVTQFWQAMVLSARRRACFGASDLRWPQPAVRQSRPSGD